MDKNVDRKAKILEILGASHGPVSASAMAESLGVSRQVIVGDIALLRAAGETVSATPRGYVYEGAAPGQDFGYAGILACKHSREQLREELYTIVDYGGCAMDVTIEHSLYGQISGCLAISSRYEADLFCEKLEAEGDKPLSSLTGGVHLHRIGCKNKETFELIRENLIEKGIGLK